MLKPHLIMMACQAAHVYWSGKLSGVTPVNEDVRRSLTLGPQQIAVELEKADEEHEKSGRSEGLDERGPRNG
jgi:hypothetical protein